MSAPNPILTRIYRGKRLEAIHRGRYVVVGADGLLHAGGEIQEPVLPRSSLKPLQLLPSFAAGEIDSLGLSDREAAVLFASHSGDEEHVAAVRSFLAKAGIPEDALRCGPHEPMDREATARLFARGEKPERIHNNCSGKHACFLLRARRLGAPLKGYLDPTHAVQAEVRETLRRLSGLQRNPEDAVFDGCGAPMYPVPFERLAELFRDLANPERLPQDYQAGAARMFDAIQKEPHFLAGRARFDTALLRARPGRFLVKCGAEGCFGIGVRPPLGPLGIAVKIDDGTPRGYETFLARFLVKLGLLEGSEASLATFLAGKVHNTRGHEVGEIRTAMD